MIPRGNNVRSVSRIAVLGAAAIIGLTACTRTEVTEMNCVRVSDEPAAEQNDGTGEALVCNPRRVRLVYRDKYSEEEAVVTDDTW